MALRIVGIECHQHAPPTFKRSYRASDLALQKVVEQSESWESYHMQWHKLTIGPSAEGARQHLSGFFLILRSRQSYRSSKGVFSLAANCQYLQMRNLEYYIHLQDMIARDPAQDMIKTPHTIQSHKSGYKLQVVIRYQIMTVYNDCSDHSMISGEYKCK